MKKIPAFLAAVILLHASPVINAQISGTVYRDINNSGSRTVAPLTPYEPGVHGVTVKAYNSNGVLAGSTTTLADGTYTLPGVTTFPVRLEFITEENEFSGKRATANKSNVQFITTTSTTADFATGYNTMFTNNANPWTATNAAINGNPNLSGLSGTARNLYIQEYAFDNTPVADGANYDNRWLGSVFGMTYQRETRSLLMAAYLKRHVGFGPGGIDAIYKAVVNTAGAVTVQPAVLFNLSSLGINVGTDPRTGGANPLGADSATPNQDLGVFSQVGKRGIGNIDLAENGKDLFVTNLFENKIHRINIGMPVKSSFTAADVTGTWTITGPGVAGTEWHIMGVKYYKGRVYVGGVTSIQRSIAPLNTLANKDADQVNLKAYIYELNPATGTMTEVMQFPFNYRRGFSNADYRFEYKNNYWRAWQNNGDADVIRGDLNTLYTPANPNSGNSTGIYYPQPMLSDIEFDVDGSMILAVRDRFADQTGFNNYLEGTNGQTPVGDGRLFRGLNSGEILRAGKTIGSSLWTIESGASVTTNGVATSTLGVTADAPSITGGTWNPAANSPWGYGAGAGQGFGPGGKYFYFNHSFTTVGVPTGNIQDGSVSVVNSHYVKSNGGFALMAGYDELIETSMDPDGLAYTSGLLRFANAGIAAGTSAGNMTDEIQLLPAYGIAVANPPANPGTMGKSNGMGDVEILFDAMPIEIGNRIWNDTNNNGIQDANETGIDAVAVILRSPGANGTYGDVDDQTWTVNTDALGNYYFDNTGGGGNVDDSRKTALGFIGLPTGNSGILNSQSYRLEIDPSQVALTNYSISGADLGGASGDHVDNDGSQASLSGVGTRVYANVNTSNNDYNFDFGFTQKSSLGDKVWLDMGAGGGTANNGIQDGTEPGVAGVTVLLYSSTNVTVGDGDDVLVSSTVTDAYGNYIFKNLTPGTNYFVKVLQPANYTFSPKTNASDNATLTGGSTAANGSDVNQTGTLAGYSDMLTLSTGEIDLKFDAGLVFGQPTTNSIGDRVWLDSDASGTQNGTEPGISGVTVTLYNNAGVVIATTVTDANGNYLFSGLADGNYRVGFTLPVGFNFAAKGGDGISGGTGDSNIDSDVNTSGVNFGKTDLIDLDAASTQPALNYINVDAGLVQTAPAKASLGDKVWLDLTGGTANVQDVNEPGVAGVTVTLYQPDGITVITSTVTDAFGNYIFNNLDAGTYVVGFTLPSGYTFVTANSGVDDTKDSDPNTGTGKTGTYTLLAGQRNISVDAGLTQNSPAGNNRLGDKVWFDANSNGTQDAGETGVAGITVTLYNGAGTAIATTATDINGNYLFVNLADGNYSVGFSNLPSGYSFTTTWSSDAANATNSDANPGTGRTGTVNLTGGVTELDFDAGLISGVPSGLGSLGNKVFYDLPGGTNGVQDAGETGVAGVTVTLQYDANNDGSFTGGELTFATQITNSLGEYLFTGLNGGSYRVVFSNGPVGYNISPRDVVTGGGNDINDSDGDNAGLAISSTSSTTGTIILAQGEDNLTVDLGIVKTSGTNGSISNQVWFDTNSDGDRDAASEPGIAGVTVTLYNSSGNVLAVTTTDANGYYLFDNLATGVSYQVGFSNYPPGLVPTSQSAALTNDLSSGGTDGRVSALISLASGQNRTDVDFGLVSVRSSLGNFVWIDTNGDGLQNDGATGVPGVTVLLYFDANNDGDFLDAGETTAAASMITDQNGQYLFTNLLPGNYQAEFSTVPSGLSFTLQTTPGVTDNGNNTNSDASSTGRTATITLSAGEADLTVDGGLFKPRAVIGNFVWVDSNGNGIQDASEPGLSGVVVTLLDGGGNPVAVAVTTANGGYLFPNVAPGNYSLSFTNLPSGVTFTTPNLGGNDALDSDVTGTTITGIVVLTTTTDLSFDAGVRNAVILPVQLVSFTATPNGSHVDLNWKVATENNILNYIIEYGTDGRNFRSIGTASAIAVSDYSLVHNSPVTGINYYRIKIVDKDGRVTYSETRRVSFGKGGEIILYPSPASGGVLSITLTDRLINKNISIEVYKMNGQLMLQKKSVRASQTEQINVSQFSNGKYLLRISSGNEVVIKNFEVQR